MQLATCSRCLEHCRYMHIAADFHRCIKTDTVKHLPKVETHCYCPQAFLSLDPQCGDDISELK